MADMPPSSPTMSKEAAMKRYLVPFVPIAAMRPQRTKTQPVEIYNPGTLSTSKFQAQQAQPRQRRQSSVGIRRARARQEPEMLSIPKNWMALELFKKIRKAVRGPVSRTRKRIVTVRERVPIEVFEELMSNMREGDARGFTRTAEGKIQPTSTSSSRQLYRYDIDRPMSAVLTAWSPLCFEVYISTMYYVRPHVQHSKHVRYSATLTVPKVLKLSKVARDWSVLSAVKS
mmetsp:Transcript_36305/g.88341  ORF Transcript_36305/g.88341 Transcript_36305/m.88341 type:complete len:229 (+) Transcript_36305:89-775(+)